MLEPAIRKDPKWVDKAWGRTKCTVESPFFQEHQLECVAGGYCSIHSHQDRANAFQVFSGKIAVVTFQASQWSRVILDSMSKPLIIPSGSVHRFEVLESGKMMEQYWPDRGIPIDTDDIERSHVGGMIQQPSIEAFDDNIDKLLFGERSTLRRMMGWW